MWDRDLRRAQLLGEVHVDRRGRYALRYRVDGLCRPERGNADLVVQVVDPRGAILASSPIRFNAGPDAVIDLALPEALEASELELLCEAIAPVLDGVAAAALSDEEMAFVAGETERPLEQVEALRAASKLAGEYLFRAHEVGVAILYAVLRRGAATEVAGLLGMPLESWRRFLEQAFTTRVIAGSAAADLEAAMSRIRALYTTHHAQCGSDQEPASLGAALSTSTLSDDASRAVVEAAVDTQLGADAFWAALANALSSDELAEARATLALNELTASHLPTMRALQAERRERDADDWRHLAARSAAEWTAFLEETPATVAGDTPDARRAVYGQQVARAVEAQYPTAAMAETLARSPEVPEALVSFLRRPDFDLLTGDVAAYASAQPEPPSDETVRDAERLQRLRRASANAHQAHAVYVAGYGSAADIAVAGPRFLDHVGPALGAEAARAVQRTAKGRADLAQALLLQVWEASAAGIPRALGPEQAELPAEWRTLFGAADYCSCERCSSVLSPAAYLVDLLEFALARDVLPRLERGAAQVRRRPDIRQIALTCANSNTEVPYIDLVIELLEDAIHPSDAAGRQTTFSAEELSARPEHLDPAAYEALRGERATYPWELPFDLWIELARAYMRELGAPRAELLDVYGEPAAADAERLGLTPASWRLVADEGSLSIDEAWGIDDPATRLARVSDLLEHGRLSFEELSAVGQTRFVGGLEIEARELRHDEDGGDQPRSEARPAAPLPQAARSARLGSRAPRPGDHRCRRGAQ